LQTSPVFTLVVIIANICGIILKESHRTNITYFQVTGTPLRLCDHCYGSRLRN